MSLAALFSALLTGAVVSASLIVAIGAQNAHVLRQGLRREHVGMVVALCAVIDIGLMSLGVSGAAHALDARPQLLRLLALGGAAFLLWYGISAARRALSRHALNTGSSGSPQPRRIVLLQTLAITLLNPHVYLDTLLLVGAIGAQQPAPLRPVFLAGAAAASLAWFAGLGFGARLLAPVFACPIAWRLLDGLVALIMLSLAVVLLLTAAR